MVHALGYSNGAFQPFKAGRLCRGRERWIEPWDPDEDEAPEVQRLVLSGAAFSDMSAADAVRGLPHSGVDPASVIASLFPRKKMLAFMEDGHPADIPDGAIGVELYEGFRAGGRSEAAMVRWCKEVSGIKEIREVLAKDIRGFAVLDGAVDSEQLFDELFLLVGASTLDSPPAQFQPAALPELVEKVRAVVLLHRDKNGPALGIYSAAPIEVDTKLATLCAKVDALLVPFAIPPMLARWDRALGELKDSWEAEAEFPVPEPEGGYHWENRRRRRRGRKDRKEDETKAKGEPKTKGESDEPDATEEPAPKRKRSKKKAAPTDTSDAELDAMLEVGD